MRYWLLKIIELFDNMNPEEEPETNVSQDSRSVKTSKKTGGNKK